MAMSQESSIDKEPEKEMDLTDDVSEDDQDDPVFEKVEEEIDDRERKVKFTDVEVVMCSLRISGNPACSDYVALELDKEVYRNDKVTVEEFEEMRPEAYRRRDTDLRLTRLDREEILNFYGCTRQDIEAFVMELRAELRAYEEAERTKTNSSLMNRARNMMGGSQGGENEDDEDDDFEYDDEAHRRSIWKTLTEKEIVDALDVLDIHRHMFTSSQAQKPPQPSSASDCTSSGSTSETSLGSLARTSGKARALVLKKAMQEEVNSEFPVSKRSSLNKIESTTGPISSDASVSSVSSRSKSSRFSKLFKGKPEKAIKNKKNMKKAADLYLMSGSGFGPLGSL